MPGSDDPDRCWWCWGVLPPRPTRKRGRAYCGERCAAREIDVADVGDSPGGAQMELGVDGEQLTLA